MHTIVIGKKIDHFLGKLYILAVAKVMDIDIPDKVKLITENEKKTYIISDFKIDSVKVEKP